MMISHFKLLLSIVVASLFMIVIRQANIRLSEKSYENVAQTIVIERAQHVARLIQFDFNRIGLGLKGNEEAILEAKPHRIVFRSDIDLDGVVDTIRYYLSDSTDAASTENPHDKILYRVANDEPAVDVPLGVTKFDLKYYDGQGRETSDPKEIRTIEINLVLQSTFSFDGEYSEYGWRTRTTPPNLAIK